MRILFYPELFVCGVVLVNVGWGWKSPPAPPLPGVTRPEKPAVAAVSPVSVTPPWKALVLPTAQTRLLDADFPEAFMLTAPNRPGSGLFGSVRTGAHGLAQFHEGVDIAPTSRDRRGEPADEVRAVAPGVVGYVNGIAGNSNYGKYVVLLHTDPLGTVYSLYAHLASVAVRPGDAVRPGTPLGVMGHTSSSPFPRARGHLHFEVGLLNNDRYAIWYRAQKLKPDHGNFNGGNLLGVDPLAFLRWQRRAPNGSFQDFLDTQLAAFEVLVTPVRLPDFFRRYPALWQGPAWRPGAALVLNCTENGLLLKGRLATDAECQAGGRATAAVLSIDAAALGRNGSHLVVQGHGGWRLGTNGERWLEVLLY